MPTGLYSVDEVLTLIFADDDSEADNMPSDDDRSSETSDSDNGAAAALRPLKVHKHTLITAKVFSAVIVEEIRQEGDVGEAEGVIKIGL